MGRRKDIFVHQPLTACGLQKERASSVTQLCRQFNQRSTLPSQQHWALSVSTVWSREWWVCSSQIGASLISPSCQLRLPWPVWTLPEQSEQLLLRWPALSSGVPWTTDPVDLAVMLFLWQAFSIWKNLWQTLLYCWMTLDSIWQVRGSWTWISLLELSHLGFYWTIWNSRWAGC